VRVDLLDAKQGEWDGEHQTARKINRRQQYEPGGNHEGTSLADTAGTKRPTPAEGTDAVTNPLGACMAKLV